MLEDVGELGGIKRLGDVDKRKALPSVLGKALVHGTHWFMVGSWWLIYRVHGTLKIHGR